MELKTKKKSYRILLVDDCADDREFYNRLLNKSDDHEFKCTEVAQGQEALEKFRLEDFDCILVDYNLPDTDGITLLTEFQQICNRTATIVLLTGQGDERIAVKAMKSGALDYLPKSDLNSPLLITVVESAIEKASLVRKLEESRQELIRSNQELENFAYVASHDLREPLRKVINFGSRLKEKFADQVPEKAREYIDIMNEASCRMRSLIDALLSYSRVNTRKPEFIPLKIGNVFSNIISDLNERIKESSGKVELCGDLPIIEAEEDLISDLFLNLLNNALKFKHQDRSPYVKVEASRVEADTVVPYWSITIKDNGIGFPQEAAEKIFEQFVRIHGRAEYEGTGMGLAICRKIVQRHKGSIKAESEPGVGSTFTVILPEQQESLEPVSS